MLKVARLMAPGAELELRKSGIRVEGPAGALDLVQSDFDKFMVSWLAGTAGTQKSTQSKKNNLGNV